MPHTDAVLEKLTFKLLLMDFVRLSPVASFLTGNKFEIALMRDAILCTGDGPIDDMDPDIDLNRTSFKHRPLTSNV